MRLIDAEPIERALFRQADKALAKNPYENARVCAFRRALELMMDAPTIASPPSDAPPNDPLTLEELREMDGEPVWCINGNGGQWGLVHVFSDEGKTYVECVTKTGFTMDNRTYGAMGLYGWLAYRRKPKEGTNGGS